MSGQEREAIVVSVDPTTADIFRTRCVTYLFTARRAELFARVVSVVLANMFLLFRLGVSGDSCGPARPGPWLGMVMLSTVVWFAWPLVRKIRVTAKDGRRLASKVSIHDEGFVAEGLWGSASAAWSVVRDVRRQRSGVVIVLDATCIDVPRISEPTSEAILGIFRQSRIAAASTAPEERGPYRAAASMAIAEDAAPEEWEPAAGHPHRALAFPSRLAVARATLRANPKDIALTLSAIATPALPFWLAHVESAIARGANTIGLFLVVMAFPQVSRVVARAWVILTDRSVVERRSGVLYAVGGAGLYVRSHNFEQRVPWDRVRHGASSKRGVVLETDEGVHAFPRDAFRTDEERAAFERVVQFELDARKPPEPAPE